MKSLITLTVICLTLSLSGCYTQAKIPQDLFNDISVFETPLKAKNEDDILKSYLDLYEIYQKNLFLLNTAKKLNNP